MGSRTAGQAENGQGTICIRNTLNPLQPSQVASPLFKLHKPKLFLRYLEVGPETRSLGYAVYLRIQPYQEEVKKPKQ